MAAVATAVAVSISGCAGSSSNENIAECSSRAFDLNAKDEPLGSNSRLVEEFSAAVQQKTELITMGEMTTRAGWLADWDRAVFVNYSTTIESLNEQAGTHLGANCLLGIPRRVQSNDSAPTSRKYTLFVENGEPVQAVEWMDYDPDLRMGVPFLTPDSELKYLATAGVMSGK